MAPKAPTNKAGRPPNASRQPVASTTKVNKKAASQSKSKPSHTDATRKRVKSRATQETATGEDELAQPSPIVRRKPSRLSQGRSVDAPRRKVDRPGQHGRTATKLRKDFPRLKPRTRYVPQSVIKAKWSHLGAPAQDQVKEILKAAKRPVVASRKDEKHRKEAEVILSQLVQRLETRLPNMPFPPKTKDLHFDLEKLMERNRSLDSQLTTSLHAIELLEAEIEKEERALNRDQAACEQLESNAKLAEQTHRQKSTKLHPLLRVPVDTEEGDPESVNLKISRKYDATSIDETDEDLAPLLDQLRNHLESIQANVVPVQGLRNTIAQAHGSLTGVLSEYMDAGEFASLAG